VHSVEAQSSPLEIYLRERNLPLDDLSSISHQLLDGSLQISQAEGNLSDLQPRLQASRKLPTDLQSRLATLSRAYIGTMEAGLDTNSRLLRSFGFAQVTPAGARQGAAGASGGLAEQVRHYRQLCMELIGNGNGQSRPAAGIAEELIETSERIRLRLGSISAAAPAESQ
jgi:hypothetical protein